MPDMILNLLITEREKLNRAIEALERETPRRGRPPKAGAAGIGTSPRRRSGMSRAARLAQSRRMKAFWAERRSTKGTQPRRRGMSRANRLAQSKRMKAFWAARRKVKAKSAAKPAAKRTSRRRPKASAAKQAKTS